MLDCLHQTLKPTPITSRDELAARIRAQRAILEQAIPMLAGEGHTILAAGIGPGQPFVYLAPSVRLANLCKDGKAAWCAHGIDDEGQRWRKGQLINYRNVFVGWMERGN
ncbi:MAG: hypothetical protein IPG66_05705 [Hydrogenophilales bacterium]|nr:hypothetical protein [Hydrogenophilales bacterium]